MKKGIIRKLAALLMVVMMLVPMAAQAEGAGYYSIKLSDLVIGYMGNELDFSGLDIGFEGGIDTENRNMVGGMVVNVPAGDASASVALEMDDEKLSVLLFDKLLSVSFDQVSEIIGMTGVDTSAMPVADIGQIVDGFWTVLDAVSSGEMEDQMNAMLDELQNREWVKAIAELQGQPLKLDYMDDLLDMFNDGVPVPVEFMVDDVSYEGQMVELALDAEQASELVNRFITDLYTGEQVMSVMEPLMADIDMLIGQIMAYVPELDGADVNVSVSDIYGMFVDSMAQMYVPGGLNICLCMAELEDGSTVMRTIWDRFTLDMSGYMKAMMQTMGQPIDEYTEEMLGMMSFDMSMDIAQMGESDGSLTIAQPALMEELICVYVPGIDTSLFEAYVYNNNADDQTYNYASLVVDPAGAGLESENGYFDINVYKKVDAAGNEIGGMGAYMGDQELFTVEYDLSNTDGINTLFGDAYIDAGIMAAAGLWDAGSAELELNWADDGSVANGYLGVYVGDDHIVELSSEWNESVECLNASMMVNCDSLVANGLMDSDFDAPEDLTSLEQPYHVINMVLNVMDNSTENVAGTSAEFIVEAIGECVLDIKYSTNKGEIEENLVGVTANLGVACPQVFGTSDVVNLLGINYTVEDMSTDELEQYEIAFQGMLMEQLELRCKLSTTAKEMDEGDLISTYVTDAVNILDMTEDDLAAIQESAQLHTEGLAGAIMEHVEAAKTLSELYDTLSMMIELIDYQTDTIDSQTDTIEITDADGIMPDVNSEVKAG